MPWACCFLLYRYGSTISFDQMYRTCFYLGILLVEFIRTHGTNLRTSTSLTLFADRYHGITEFSRTILYTYGEHGLLFRGSCSFDLVTRQYQSSSTISSVRQLALISADDRKLSFQFRSNSTVAKYQNRKSIIISFSINWTISSTDPNRIDQITTRSN